MSRSFSAARRAAKKQPVEFSVDYVDVVAQPMTVKQTDRATGQVTETVVENHVEVPKTETFTCRGEISSLAIGELMANADLDAASEAGIATIRDVFYGAFADRLEYARFFHFAQRHLDNDDVIDILYGLVEDFIGRPTLPSGDSSDEPSPSGDDSKVITLPGGFRVARPEGQDEEEQTGS